MDVQLRKVDGGWDVFIPDELADQAGFRPGVRVEAAMMAEMLVLQQPEFVAAARDAMFARITPDTLHDPREPITPPVGFERAG